MKLAFFYCCLLLKTVPMMSQEKTDFIKISQDLLYAVKTDEPADSLKQQLSNAPVTELQTQLGADAERKAFWLNIYNAYTQIGLKEDPNAYQHRNKFFSRKFIRIAGHNISLDLVEHGILRRSKWKYSLGYFNKPFKLKFEKKFRIDKPDYRIHFALNCGAKSCPPIAFYKPEQIDKQLDLAMKVYLKNEVLFNGKDLTVELPAILSWFRGDFGGKKGIIRLLHLQQIVPENVNPGIKWKKYDWTLSLKAFE
jgi:Protein of unknown function, DUF547